MNSKFYIQQTHLQQLKDTRLLFLLQLHNVPVHRARGILHHLSLQFNISNFISVLF